jgi:dihydroflavonol-4-reductase
VGANLVAALLKRGMVSRVLCRSGSSLAALTGLEFEKTLGDVLDSPSELAKRMEGCDWVFHAAGTIHGSGPHGVYPVNVEGTCHILEAARLAGIRRLVFTSSLSALGVSAPGEQLTEESRFNLTPRQFPYGHSKVLAEEAVLHAVEAGLDAVITNPATVIGPRDVNHHGGAMLLQAAKRSLRFYPPGGSSFIGVEDLAEGHIAAAEQGRRGERYILGSENLSYREVFTQACEVVGSPPPKIAIPGWGVPVVAGVVQLLRPLLGGLIPVDAKQVGMSARTLYADSSKAVRELGLPQTAIRQALQSGYEWYKENGYLGS